ncbi:MAG: PAS domain S-box protein [Chromatiales bacterium]|nr:PAS domain S-box protein [Chromatiales bacterium]
MTTSASARHAESSALPKSRSVGVSPNRFYLIIALNLVGFILLLLVDQVVTKLAKDLDMRQANEQTRVLIGELLTNDLSRLEAKTYQMAATTGARAQTWVFKEIEGTLDRLEESIHVIEKGGVITRTTRLNIESQDVMTREHHYAPYRQSPFTLEAIDLSPKLIVVRQRTKNLLKLLGERDEYRRDSKREEYIEIIAKIKETLQTFPPLFTRMTENANRLFFESQKELIKIRQSLDQKRDFYGRVQVFISIAVIAAVLIAAMRLLRQIRRSNEELSDLARNLEFMKFALDEHAIVSTTDVEGNITYVNDRFCDVTGYSGKELLGRTHRFLKSGEHGDEFYAEMWRAISAGKVWHGEVKNRSRAGKYFWMSSTIVPFLDDQGRPFQYICIRTDVTQMKELEEEIRENNRFLKNLTDTIGEGVYAQDADGKCHFLNPEAERLFGWTLEELAERGIHETIHHQLDNQGRLEPAEACRIHLAVMTHETYRSDDEEFVNRNGQVFPVSVVSMPLFTKGELTGSVTVFHDISRRKETERLLAQAKENAERANMLKSEFLSNMSHELRTPLNAILGFSQLLEMDDELDSEQLESIQEISKAGSHLLTLINEILDLSKIEAGKVQLSMERVLLADLFHECIGLVETLAEKEGISLEVEVSDGDVIWTDYTRIKQVLLNLLSNAIKYNRPNGSVKLSALRVDGNMLRLSVKDTGPGIAADMLEELFKPFNRLKAEQSSIEGTGIGLTITKRIVQMIGSEIQVDSQVSRGSDFYFDVPLLNVQTPAVRVPTHGEETSSFRAGEAIPSAPMARVLYIEDNPANLRLVAKALKPRKHIDLRTANLPEKGIELAKSEPPDLVLLDISMPGMDGFEVLDILRQDPRFASTPFFAVTANAMEFDKEKGKTAGFNEYLTKPLHIPTFLSKIDEYLVSPHEG